MRTDLDSVLLAVKLAISAAAGARDPLGVVLIPLDRFAEPALPGFARPPAEFRFDQCGINCVATIMTGTIFDKLDQRFQLNY